MKPDESVSAPPFVEERRSFEQAPSSYDVLDLLTVGATVVGAVVAADHGERLTMALMLITLFWTVVRMLREKRVST